MKRILGTALALVLSSCAPQIVTGPLRITEVRPPPPTLKTVEVTLQRDELLDAISRGGEGGGVRMVPIYNSVSPSGEIPEYRLFNVSSKSVYSVLGLENADVLVAAHGYVVQQPNQFNQYVAALPQLETGEIEVRREGQPIVFRYRVVTEKAESADKGDTVARGSIGQDAWEQSDEEIELFQDDGPGREKAMPRGPKLFPR